jgi:hypothetical protein
MTYNQSKRKQKNTNRKEGAQLVHNNNNVNNAGRGTCDGCTPKGIAGRQGSKSKIQKEGGGEEEGTDGEGT